MGLIKITFDGSSVSSKQDADINYHVTGLVPAGIIRGLGSELSYTASNNYITFQDGYVQIYGRRLYVEAGSQVYVSLDSTKYGYVVITVNLLNNTATLGVAESSSSAYPTLTQENLHKDGNTYQMPIAKYSKTTTSLSLQPLERTFIETPLSVANTGYDRAVDYLEDYYDSYNWKGSWTSNKSNIYLTESQWSTYNKTMFILHLNIGVTVCVPGRFISATSSFTVDYYYNGKMHTISTGCSSSSKYLIFTCSDTSHYIRNVYRIR